MSSRLHKHARAHRGLVGTAGLWLLLWSGSVSAAEPAVAEQPVDFARDVQPIFVAHCQSCHGERRQESDLRLDLREAAFKGGAAGAVIVPGKSGESPLLERIASDDPDLRMPPEGARLPAEAVATIRAWIEQGANWPAAAVTAPVAATTHWSLKPLVRPQIPTAPAKMVIRNPIDAFVGDMLSQQGLHASPEADRLALLRRLTFDLTGLPPTPEEAAAFLGDESADAYERLVDRLLASPRYGERWARHWMDVVHFAETHGNDQDRPRENAWPYRDYLIRSFNDDKPYARFVSEQTAGDVLYPSDPQATVALGFLAAGPWDESSLMCIVDDTSDKRQAQLLDRDDMVTNVMSTFTSTTVHCARCHNHKFDPISQADYYALQAVFAGVDRADRAFDPDPRVHERRLALNQRRRELPGLAEKLAADPAVDARLLRMESELRSAADVWRVVTPHSTTTAQGSIAVTQADGSVLFSGPNPEQETYTFNFEGELAGVTAIRVEVLTDPSLPHQGPGRQENGNLHLSEVKVSAGTGELANVAIKGAYADFDQEGWTAAHAIDGKPETAWGIHPEVGKPHHVVLLLAQPLNLPAAGRLQIVLEQLHGRSHLIGRARCSLTTIADPASARPLPAKLAAIFAVPANQRTAEQRLELVRALVEADFEREWSALPPQAMVYAAGHEFTGKNNFHPATKPRPVHLLRRGDIHQPLELATPGALSCVSAVPARFEVPPDDEGQRRARLAAWLVHPENVLAWRSIVNRVWHYHFDRGLVDTPNDLGRMGAAPSHPELLDWLAVEFRDGGGSLKALHRLIVTSATYRQSSRNDEALAKVDGGNRYLWRMNGRRLDAESIRDAVLVASGQMDPTMGGPSVKQFVESKGIHVTPNVDYLAYDVDAPGNARRSVYRFLFRTLPDPLMDSLDCPDGSQLAPVRAESVTALQALTLLDNRFIVRQSEHMAARLARAGGTLPEQVRRMFAWTVEREPAPEELARWQAYVERHGLANACRMMFNTNEFVFVN